MVPKTAGKRAPSSRLLKVLAPYERILVVMHDNPDPDAIASGWAVVTLIDKKLDRRATLIGGGAIVRAENRHMVDLLGPPVQLVLAVDAPQPSAAILVDCGPEAENQLLTRVGVEPVAVIDHHLTSDALAKIPFVDVRPDVAASATIAASYLVEQKIEPGPKLATALWYAMRTETRGSEFQFSPLDQQMLVWLTERADPEMLAEIESAPLSRDYYADLAAALREATIYRDTAFCLLPRAIGAEIVGEIADLVIRCQGLASAFCAAVCDDDLVVSVRTSIHGGNAANLVRKTLADLGGAGGHAHRAGGKIPQVGPDLNAAADLCRELRSRWLAACGVDPREPGTPLLSNPQAPGGV